MRRTPWAHPACVLCPRLRPCQQRAPDERPARVAKRLRRALGLAPRSRATSARHFLGAQPFPQPATRGGRLGTQSSNGGQGKCGAVGIFLARRLGETIGETAPTQGSIPPTVIAPQSFAGKYATLQRYNGTLQRWVNVKRVLLRANSTGVAPTVISSVTFRSSIRARLKIRVVLPQLQVGTRYIAGRSNVILS